MPAHGTERATQKWIHLICFVPTACVSGAAQKIDTFASENFVCVCCGNPAPDTAGLEAQRAGNTSCLPPFSPRGRQGSHWHGPTQRQRETPVYQANQTQVRAIKEKLRCSLKHGRYGTHAGAERDSLPARTFAPGPGLEKTTGRHGRTSSSGYRDSA